MSLRRPRVKPSANLDMKRKIKSDKPPDDVKFNIDGILDKKNIKTITTDNLKSNQIIVQNHDTIRTFKQPQAVSSMSKFSSTSCTSTPLSIDSGIIGCNTINISSQPISTTIAIQHHHHQQQQQQQHPVQRPRQRIRPMPCFGIRRNSVQGANSDAEDDSRKHRSHNYPYYSDIPPNRRRTVSACSNASDTNIAVRDRIRKISTTVAADDQVSSSSTASKIERKSPDKSALKMFDYIYYNPNKNPMVTEKKPDTIISEQNLDNNNGNLCDPDALTEVESSSDKAKINQGDDSNKDDTQNAPVPQLILSANGELVLDEKSLIIETTAKKEARVTLAKSDVIYHDENTGCSGFYRRQKRTRDWTFDETVKFYRCLNTVGTDFSLMLSLFPNRSRRDLKLKFKKEEKCNANLVDKALLHPKAFDIDELKMQFEKDEREASEKINKLEDVKGRTKTKQIKERKGGGLSKAARMLSQGDIAYQNEHMLLKPSKISRLCSKGKLNIATATSSPSSLPNQTLPLPPAPFPDALTQKVTAALNNQDLTDSRMLVDAIIEKYELENSQLAAAAAAKQECIDSISEFSDDVLDIKNKYYNVDNVLQEIADGSLMLVASEDPDDPDMVRNEIYLYCKVTNELSDEPLDLPREIVDCIANEISK